MNVWYLLLLRFSVSVNFAVSFLGLSLYYSDIFIIVACFVCDLFGKSFGYKHIIGLIFLGDSIAFRRFLLLITPIDLLSRLSEGG